MRTWYNLNVKKQESRPAISSNTPDVFIVTKEGSQKYTYKKNNRRSISNINDSPVDIQIAFWAVSDHNKQTINWEVYFLTRGIYLLPCLAILTLLSNGNRKSDSLIGSSSRKSFTQSVVTSQSELYKNSQMCRTNIASKSSQSLNLFYHFINI